MKSSLRLLLLFSAAVSVSLVACGGGRRAAYRPLMFEWADQQDTADFVHIRPENQPISVELFANTDSLTDSTYWVRVQIGVYGPPDFYPEYLSMADSAITATADGLAAMRSFSTRLCCRPNIFGPYVGMSLCSFEFDRDSLEQLIADDPVLRILVNFDGYATYGEKPIQLEPATMLDPWFNWFTNAAKEE
jgi:hypothetical protein